jgi:hypothetical protein
MIIITASEAVGFEPGREIEFTEVWIKKDFWFYTRTLEAWKSLFNKLEKRFQSKSNIENKIAEINNILVDSKQKWTDNTQSI